MGKLTAVSALGEPGSYRLHIRATSFTNAQPRGRLTADFLVFIAVSPYPF